MATCKDCISFSRCKEMYEVFGVYIDLENSAVCKHFKNKADVAEVVRCRDCEHYDKKYHNCNLHSEEPDQYSSGFCFHMDEEDFCSYGERKEGE